MQISVLHPKELDASAQQAWLALLRNTGRPPSGFLHPGFALAVGARREDARICLVEDAGALMGVLTVQRTASRSAMPLGSPITDHMCLIMRDGVDLPFRDMLRALRIDRLDLIHADATDPRLAPYLHETMESLRIDLDLHRATIAENGRVARFPLMRDLGRKRRKLEREIGAVRMQAFDQAPADVRQVLAWKADQYALNRIPPILGREWVMETLERLLERTADDLRLVSFSLKVEDKLVAGLVGLQSSGVLHAWFPAFDTRFADHSVGSLAWLDMIDACSAAGLAEIDMGPGRYPYKLATANGTRALGYGLVGRNNPASVWRAGMWRAETLLGKLPDKGVAGRLRALPGRARRWIDLRRGLA